MKYIKPNPNPSGAYGAPKEKGFPGCVALTDNQAAVLLQYNGFVILSEGDDGETIVTPNTEAWEAWKASLPPEPEPTPSVEERMASLESSNTELYEALNMILTGVTE